MTFLRPLITEKSLKLVETANEYTFEVKKNMTKTQAKKAVGDSFGVTVLSVKSIALRGKTKKTGRRGLKTKTPDTKKMIVKLGKDSKISLFEIKEEKKK